jgi:hypothetical protein
VLRVISSIDAAVYSSKQRAFDFKKSMKVSLFIAAAGFETRSLSFLRRANPALFTIDRAIILRYLNQRADNAPNLKRLTEYLRQFARLVSFVDVDVNRPNWYLPSLQKKLEHSTRLVDRNLALVDISGMAHVLICSTLYALDRLGSTKTVIYTEALDYYPRRPEWPVIRKAIRKNDIPEVAKYLQTAGLREIQIPIVFGGNARPGYRTCLFVLVGYEPNRIQGLLDEYAPSAIVAFFGKSPHRRFLWRSRLSVELHQRVFDSWPTRKIYDLSTLDVETALEVLEAEYAALRSDYDVAVVSQCSKMQTVASYLLWRKHPEIQLVFTSAVRIDSKRYSRGEGRTYELTLP